MAKGFAKVPREARYVLANATLPAVLADGFTATPDADGLVAADITVRNGIIERIDPPGRRTALPRFDLDRGMVWPCFVDMHTHLDKGHIWPRQHNPDGTFGSALEAVRIDREMHWRPHDVERRMDFALRAAYAHGTALVRTHLDSAHPQHRESWPAFARMRERWAGRVELQAVSLAGGDHVFDDAFVAELVQMLKQYGGVLGGAFAAPRDTRANIEAVVRIARDNDFDLDLHIDETEDPDSRCLRYLAEAVIDLGFKGKVNAGHCCSLARQMTDEADETLDLVANAGVSIVSLPMCNMYLQDRHRVDDADLSGPARTPRWRGITLLHELAARGVPVAVASDNTRDPFYAYGDLDMVEVFREAVRIAHFDHPYRAWPATVARAPAAIIGRPDRGVIAAGLPADLVLFRARSFTELNSRPQADRTVLRAGKPIDRALPDYRELDDIMVTA